MATLTDPGDLKPDSASEAGTQAGIDQAEAFANDPANASPDYVNRLNQGAGKPGGTSRLTALAKSGAAFGLRNKRKLAGGGLVATLIATIIFSFISLLPLKIESMMKNIFQKRVGDPIERVMERRIQTIMERYIAGGGDSGNVVATNHLVTDFYKTLRIHGFEASLEKNQGIKFSKDGTGKVLVTSADGTTAQLGSSEARAFMNSKIRDETHWVQFYKRYHLRKWMRNALGIQKWKFFSKKEDTKSNPTAAEAEFASGSVEAAAEATDIVLPGILDCLDGGSCPGDNHHIATNPDGIHPTGTDAQSVGQEVEKELDQPGNKKPGVVEKALLKSMGALFGEKLGAQITQHIIKAGGVLAVLGAVDVAANLDNFFYGGHADSAIVDLHKVQYASAFAQWLTMSDQIIAGDASGSEVNAAGSALDGGELSAAFNDVYLNQSGGVPAPASINEQGTPLADNYKNNVGNLPLLAGFTIHQGLSAYRASIGQAMKLFNEGVSVVSNGIIDILNGLGVPIKALMNWAGGWVTSELISLFGTAYNGLETGAPLVNAIDAGGAVTGEEFLYSVGGQQFTKAQGAASDQELLAYEDQQTQGLSLGQRLFSTGYPGSLVNKIAVALPGSAGGALNDAGQYALAVISSPSKLFKPLLSLLTGPAHAAGTTRDLYGLNQYGFTNSELNDFSDTTAGGALDQAVANAAVRLNKSVSQINYWDVDADQDCPPTQQDGVNAVANLCKLDVTAIQSLGAMYAPSDALTLGSGASAAPGGTVDTSTLDQDSSNIACDPRTTDLGVTNGYANGTAVPIRLCALPNLPSTGEESDPSSSYWVSGANYTAIVNSRVSTIYYNLVDAATKAGVTMSALSSFRTMAHQTALCSDDAGCSSGNYSKVAKPGTSNHQMGLAIDFNMDLCDVNTNGVCSDPSNPIWVWLNSNAASFGIKQYPVEAWHWSPTGN